MADGKGIIGDDGKLLIRDDGTVDVCEECCGCPDTLTVTLSSINLCTGCLPTFELSNLQLSESTDGAYSTPFTSDTATQRRYSATFPSLTMSADRHLRSSDCAGAVNGTSETGMSVIVFLDKDTCKVNSITIRFSATVESPLGGTSGISCRYFGWVDVSGSGADLGTTLSNQTVTCDTYHDPCPEQQTEGGSGDCLTVATGGTAVVESA